jgi:hypothetical protein
MVAYDQNLNVIQLVLNLKITNSELFIKNLLFACDIFTGIVVVPGLCRHPGGSESL